MTGIVVIAVAVVIVLGVGGWRAYSDGRFRSGAAGDPAGPTGRDGGSEEAVLIGTPYADRLGERASLLQFSSAFCAPCRATRRTLADVAGLVPGVAHVEVDAEQHLDLVRRVGVLRTPTTLVLDAGGREVSRAAGAPSKPAVLASLGWLGEVRLDVRDEHP